MSKPPDNRYKNKHNIEIITTKFCYKCLNPLDYNSMIVKDHNDRVFCCTGCRKDYYAETNHDKSSFERGDEY